MLNRIWKWFLQGIALVAPVALTIALLAWLGSWFEQTLGGLIKAVVPPAWYFEGLGLIAGILSTLAVGLAANLFSRPLAGGPVRLRDATERKTPRFIRRR